jgi:DNA-binding CsgD family transcriptional regulator
MLFDLVYGGTMKYLNNKAPSSPNNPGEPFSNGNLNHYLYGYVSQSKLFLNFRNLSLKIQCIPKAEVRHQANSKTQNNLKYDELIRFICHYRLCLTSREIDCYLLLAKGYRSKEIAKKLTISYRTVEKHIENIKDKSHCQTVAGIFSQINRYLFEELS